MKKLPLFTAIIIGLVILIMFLPYILVDIRGEDYMTLEENVTIAGIQLVEVYFLLLGFIFIAILSTVKRNSTTALISLIFSFGLGFLFLFNIAFIISKPIYYFIDFEWGFILHGFLVFVYFILLLINLAMEYTIRKKNRQINQHIIDDF